MISIDDIRKKQFTTVRLREGYDQVEVDSFLERIEDAFDQLAKQTAAQRTAPPPQAESSRILAAAQATADQVVNDAHSEAVGIVAKGQQDAEAHLMEARVNAEAARKDAVERQRAEISSLEVIRQELETAVAELRQQKTDAECELNALVAHLQQVVPDHTETQIIPPVPGAPQE